MEINFKNLRVPATYPVYPPYHTGKYLEEYFYEYYLTNKDKFDKLTQSIDKAVTWLSGRSLWQFRNWKRDSFAVASFIKRFEQW